MRNQVLAWLNKNVPESRLQHILRVEQTAIELAHCHQVNPEKAAQAGLLHDLAKFFKPQQLLQIAENEGLKLDPIEIANPHLLHAQASAVVARDEFGVKDEEVLQAVADHTLGCPGMSPLSCVVFLADSLEPGRGDTLDLRTLRQIAREHLAQAVWRTCDYSLRHLVATRRLIHPRTVATRNWFLEAATQKQAAQTASSSLIR